MSDTNKVLLVITPSKARECKFNLIHAESGEGVNHHFCSNESFAKGDLYDNNSYVKDTVREKWGDNIEVKFLDETDITEGELKLRNSKWWNNELKRENEESD